EGGHLIGLGLGGPDHPCNIAPMTKGSNCGSGTWGEIEQQIRTIIKLGGGATTVDLTITYDDSLDPRIPARVKGTITGGVSTTINKALRAPNDITNIITPNLKGIFSDIKELAQDLNIDDSNPHARLDVVDRIRHQDQNVIVRVQNIRNRIRRIPILASYPSSGIAPKTKKGRVLPVQRILMMLHNRYLNGGLLMAEDTHNLGLMMREWQAQADHIRPYARSKDSSYKNLRLLHHRTNNKRGAGARGAGGMQKRVRKAPNRLTY
ncbi:MAG: HNH endonuclease domain-containing protein, partial [Candidatus Kapaibacterium sp.]